MGDLIPNFFRVVQRLLNIAVIIVHVFKGSRLFDDMRLNHGSPRAVSVLYNCFFFFFGGGVGGTELHCT